jgi:preprotein translocase subunit SecA
VISPEQAEDWASEFAESMAFSLLGEPAKEQGPEVAAEFLRRAGEVTEDSARRVLLEEIPLLDLPPAVRAEVPGLLAAFLGWLEDSGRLSGGRSLGTLVGALGPAYRERLSPKGGLRTPPLVRSAPRLGRNDPCPCGSGKKYKKCCGT